MRGGGTMDGDLHDFYETGLDNYNDPKVLLKRIHDLRLGLKFILHQAEHGKGVNALNQIAWKARLLLKGVQNGKG
jgi:hypothetical protein